MNWTKTNLETQFKRGKSLGWIPLIQTAATTYGFHASTLWAVGSRETNLDPKYLKVAGDHGHGFGLFQADIGSYPQWINSGAWRDAGMSVLFGAKVLNDKLQEIKNRASKANVEIDEDTALRLAIAAYNHGSMGVFSDYKKGLDPDRGTTGHDYSTDVLKRESIFAEFLNDEESIENTEEVVNAPVAPPVNVVVAPPTVDIKPDEPAAVVEKQVVEHPIGLSTWKSTLTGIWTSLGVSVSSLGSIVSGTVHDPTLLKILIALVFVGLLGAGLAGLIYMIIRTVHINRQEKLAQEVQIKEMDIKADPTKYNVTAGK